ncbi:MAG: hypothetical protein A2487_10110 [Candidatus Raymondbacteria bacterium RifOxyC12_full_50_8]|uniref:Secretion system C-terminal sorting domain-containing protein n=1 Tax=Candidatus Raymondbacteria bacterium RIFOXYD12_FULL_49_13 TaxID=1817890 RepID=A0A1F7F7D5_UNCRA|nr:MAG: hypothetical protein A2248_00180 [Candidatus Raymondbacteria bacterium RIFOXYA2_FULL_49_16]OGJ96161.1 MAG: hypothetical protein A2453_05530 [Candidatus Raymondbacteria bacterium RIFOXYC2_FULL_50_21]OGJ99234.1 MAG: hypothetical protein A2487_10110 [Candidatus Raymondbacteria bacterium RifOxyC12_full_50_8]OGJ99686.1 MAG: hypothetical protein A2350_05660 [Candidatus Raymondbacteria bacterium RifOxyB12_full_50_8]OGK02416.1 MAG: hypothetical protein A2519_14455 [Candidatus Raymondbacteria ba
MQVLMFCVLLAVISPAFSQTEPAALLWPQQIVYEGAFKFSTSGFGYGGEAFGYYPAGDPSGPNDGYPGSLFGSGYGQANQIAEFAIPTPVISPTKSIGAIPQAATLQSFIDPFSSVPYVQNLGVAGLLYLPAKGSQTSGKLYANLKDEYNSLSGGTHMAWLDVTLNNPNTAGFWRADTFNNVDIARYLLEIPQTWSDSHISGKSIGTGDGSNYGASGPCLLACAPWQHGNPPTSQTVMDAVPLLFYDKYDHIGKKFTEVDWMTGAAWVTYGSRSALVFYGPMMYSMDRCYFYGHYGPGIYPCLTLFNPADIEQVTAGTLQPWAPRWYARKCLDPFFFSKKMPGGGCRFAEDGGYVSGGMAYDREHGKLYVSQMYGNGTDPIIHVFRIDTTVNASESGVKKNNRRMPSLAVFPNPFNPSTLISVPKEYISGESGLQKELKVFNARGELVADLSRERGPSIEWNASHMSSGVYVIRFSCGSTSLSKAVMLLK